MRSLIVGDDVADALIQYPALLRRIGSADCVVLKCIGVDGRSAVQNVADAGPTIDLGPATVAAAGGAPARSGADCRGLLPQNDPDRSRFRNPLVAINRSFTVCSTSVPMLVIGRSDGIGPTREGAFFMPRHATGAVRKVEWRQLGRDLWAGTGEFGPVGTIEHGRRYTAIDVSASAVGRCRTLEDAEALLEHLAEAWASTTAVASPSPLMRR